MKFSDIYSTRTRKLGIAFVISLLIFNFPILLSIFPAEVAKAISTAAWFTIQGAVGTALFSVKDLTQTGGSNPITPEASDRVQLDQP